MAIKSKEDILTAIKGLAPEDDSDAALSIFEDVSDTLDDLSTRLSEAGDWKAKYEENDKAWREKYKERFLSKPVDEGSETTDVDADVTEDEEDAPKTYDDLFTTEEA